MDEAAYYHGFAKEYGWTPDQVDNAPALLVDRMMIVAHACHEIEAERNRPPRVQGR